jgi:hypothetical protein
MISLVFPFKLFVVQPVAELGSLTLAFSLYLKVNTPISGGRLLSGNPKANLNPTFEGTTLYSLPMYLLSVVRDLILPDITS